MLLDKTGTLTSGKPRIGERQLLARGRRKGRGDSTGSVGLEASSNHPYAQAIIALAQDGRTSSPTEQYPISPTNKMESMAKSKGARCVRSSEPTKSQVSGSLLKALERSTKRRDTGQAFLLKEDKPVALFTFIHDDLREGTGELVEDIYMLKGVNVEISVRG